MHNQYCYLNGKILDIRKARISPMDLGFLRGFAVFDLLRTYSGEPFLFGQHVARLKNSAKELGLPYSLTKNELRRVIRRLLQKNALGDATVKTVVSGGESDDGLHYENWHATTLIMVKPVPQYPQNLYTHGVAAITQEYLRPTAKAKTTHYVHYLLQQKLLRQKGVYEVLYTKDGCILEGATSSFFAIKGNQLVTAKEDVLDGTLRDLILRLAKKKCTIVRRPLAVRELPTVTEAFLTSTTRNILPITRINGQAIGNKKVGLVTAMLMEKLERSVSRFLRSGKVT